MKYYETLIVLYGFVYISRCDKVDYYKKVITNQIRSSVNYRFRTDASEFKPTEENEPVDFGEFDFIIIGGGSTGSVITNRLSEFDKWTILLLEAGGFGNDSTDIPALQQYVILSDYNWGFKTVPQKKACLGADHQQCEYPRGQGIGGTSLINGVAYVRGNRHDFDKLESAGNPGWGFENVLHYFKKSEHFRKTDPNSVIDWAYHGTEGPLTVEQLTPRGILANTWLEANQERGYKIVDYNGKRQTGTGVFQKTTNHGKRADTGNAYIKPIVNRSNLKILTKAYVTKIIIKKKKATGVKFTYRGKYYIARTKKEVILSAGVIGSPQILMLSGIGPKEHLKEIGIKNIANLQVGNNLRDQNAYTGLSFDSNVTLSNGTLRDYIKQFLNGDGPLTSPTLERGSGYVNTNPNPSLDYPEIEMLWGANDYIPQLLDQNFGPKQEVSWQNLKYSASFSIFLMGLHTKSIGTLRLKSNSPFDYPLLDPKVFSDPEDYDIGVLYKAINLTLDLIKIKAFAKINATLVKQKSPACEDKEYLSKDYWYCILRQYTEVGYHPIGTCKMGPNPEKGDVVDANNRVYGINGLRVADASIFPFPLSGNPNAVCVMVGEKISDQLKQEYTLPDTVIAKQ